MSAKPITGKTVVVTGGSRGIGIGLVKKFLARDNTVIATSRKSSDATHLLKLRTEYPERLHVMDLDTSAKSSIVAWAEGIKTSGVNHVDVLINNAGVYGRRLDLADFEEEDFLFAFRANTMGPFFVVQQLLKQDLLGSPPDAAPARPSLIANMSSIVGSNADPTVSANIAGGFAYRASKSALNVISSTLSRDLSGRGVTVVALHPGYVKTDMTGGEGYVDVEESSSGLVGVLESGRPLNGRFIAFDGNEIPW